MSETSEKSRRPNRLIHETSPYLLQHAYNPVDWYPWGEEALRRAREENKPILLSIGYSACHWCHVMERESFEDERIAALMNEHFVCIKVDREERPDLDEIYMQATLALNQGQGGWPMTVFLTPDQQPIYAGTYFPPTDRWGRPGFATLLQKVAEFWRKDPAALREQATHLTEVLKKEAQAIDSTAVGEAEIEAAVAQLAADFDPRYGGFGGAPKFPPATALTLLLRWHRRTGDARALQMVRKTLDAMAAGGIYDQIGGGFARYATDERWLVPHFEKMLYDNALLARVYLEAYQATGAVEYRRIATETLDYVLLEMTAPEGGFYSATDADSEGEEGKFFVWTPEEIRLIVQTEEDARCFCVYYDITAAGNWEGKNIPNRLRPADEVARELGLSMEDLQATIARLRPLVYEARRTRVPPGLDDKILTAWNGMMLGTMAEGARVLDEARYLTAATRAADFLLRTLSRPDGGLYRTYRQGKAHLKAYLEDYASLAEGLIDLYEAGADERFLHEAVRLAERILADFSDEEHGGFYTTAADHEALIVRRREGSDGATPSANAVAASVLARLAFHFGREDFREAAARAIRAHGRTIACHPRAFAKSLLVVDMLLHGPVELALVGTPGEAGYEALRAELRRHYLPDRILAHADPSQNKPSRHPLLAGKGLVEGQAALYVCRHFACQAPVTEPGQVAAALAAAAGPAPETARAKVLSGSRLPGSATPGGTGAYAARMVNWLATTGQSEQAEHGYTALGSTGLTTSRLGFGGYRIAVDDPEHREALRKALREGCNLIDTSTNYGDGESERLVGSVLAELIKKGELRREEVIVVSKIGYVQGQNLARAAAREQAGKPYPDMVKYGEGIWHCIHPEFLADQFEASLDRLGLETLDVCLLHNPEYFLSEAAHRGRRDLDQLRDEFYGRLRAAFAYFETQVAAGRLRWYGVSSNTCTAEPDDPEATSLSRMLAAARDAAAGASQAACHFGVLQCPMNLFEAGALLTPNTGQDNRQTVLDLATRERLAVLVNRPLNAMPTTGRSGLIRLADRPLAERPDTTEPQAASFEHLRDRVAKLEEEFRRDIAPHIRAGGQGVAPADYFRWAEELARVQPQVQNLEHWEQIEAQMVAPHLNQVLRALTHYLSGDLGDRWQGWRDRYIPELLALLRAMRRDAAGKSREAAAALAATLDPFLPADKRKESLSRKALWVLASTPGVTCVLIGMRKPAYVEDALAILRWPPFPNPAAVYEAAARSR
ncbi:aldo/keto reductase [Nitrospira sp. Kam-Ns4a]